MKIKTGTLFLLLIWCLFMGVTAISIGFGSVFPSMNRVAGPFVCPNGHMELTTQDYQVSPTESGAILNWYCVDNKSETKTELNPFIINVYAGPIYGLLLFIVVLAIWYVNSRWNDPSKSTPEQRKRVGWLDNSIVILIVVGMTLFSLMPLFGSVKTALEPTATPDSAATSIALTLHEMSSGTPIAFTSTEKPLTNWNGIPIMSQATAGQEVEHDHYSFRVPVDSGTIESFYNDALKPLGWNPVDHQWLGTEYTKDKRTLLVTYAPNSDLQSWIVTLVLIP